MSEVDSLPPELEVENVIRVLGDIQERKDIYRKYILIPDDLTDDQVVSVLRELHKIEPDTWYYLMDSDAKFDQMLSALPETKQNDYSNWPEEYVEKHFVARLKQTIQGDGKGRSKRTWYATGALVRKQINVELD